MLKVRLDGYTEIIKTFKETKQKLTNYREYFEDYVTPALFNRFDDIFEKQGAVSNFSKWQRLRLATIAEKKRKGYPLEILRRTNRLYKAFTGRNSYGRILTYPNRLVFKNFVQYAIYHETGTSRGLPKRTTVARIIAYKEFHKDLATGMSKYLTP